MNASVLMVSQRIVPTNPRAVFTLDLEHLKFVYCAPMGLFGHEKQRSTNWTPLMLLPLAFATLGWF